MRPLKYLRYWLALGGLYALLVLWGSLTSLTVNTELFSFDKAQHFLGYLVLCGWFCGLFARRWHLFVLLAAVAFGILLEIAQALGGIRTFEFQDIVANTLGAAVGFALLGWTALSDVFLRVERHLPPAQN